jgi:outer membrane lipoprotein carrier protein
MRFLVRASLVLAAAGGLSPLRAQSSSPNVDATLERASATYAKVKTVRASFEQTLVNPLTGNTLVSHGTIQQQMPNRMSVRFTDPKGDRIVSDGESLWLYLPSSAPGQVIKLPVREGAMWSMDAAQQFLANAKMRFAITDSGSETVSGRPTRALTLVPKAEAQFTKATVWLDEKDGTLRQFEVTEQSGLVRRVRLTTLALNAPVDRAEFRFIPPDGVRVLDQQAMR